MIPRAFIGAGAAALLAANGTAARAGWEFQSTASALAGYDSNIQRVGDDAVADGVSLLQADLDLRHDGPRHRFSGAYRPVYEAFVDHGELDNLSHLAVLGWRFTGARSELDLDGSYGRTEDPRLVAVGPAVAIPDAAPFLVERSSIDRLGLRLGGRADLSPRSWLVWRGTGQQLRYADPRLLDSEDLGAHLGVEVRAHQRVSWTAAVRYDHYDPEERRSSAVYALEAGATLRLRRSLELALQLTWVLDAQGELETGAGRSRLFGDATLSGNARRVRWSVAYGQDYSSGGGVTTAVVNTSAGAQADWEVGRRSALSLGASRSTSEDAEVGGRGEIRTDQASLRYQHRLGGRWSLALGLGGQRQENEAADAGGSFDQGRVTVGVSYSTGKRA